MTMRIAITTSSKHSRTMSLFSASTPFLLFLLLLVLPAPVPADRTKAKIYVDLKEARGCFRRMNADGVVGCQSSFNGDVGVVHFVDPKVGEVEPVGREKDTHGSHLVDRSFQDFTADLRLIQNHNRDAGFLQSILDRRS